MTIKISPITFTVRGYSSSVDTSKSLHNLRHEPHEFMCTIQIIENIAFVSAFMGKLKLSDRRELSKSLKDDYGIEDFVFRRGDTLKTITN